MKTRRRFIIALLFIFAAAWVLTPQIMHFLGQELLNTLHERGARIRVEGLSGTRVGLAAELIEGWASIPVGGSVKAFPISLKVDTPSTALRTPLLSPWSPQAVFHGTAYAGTVQGSLPLISALKQRPSLTLAIKGVDLSLHPQARAFGVEAGSVDAQVDNHPVSGLPDQEARYSLDMRGLSVTLPPMVAQIVKITTLANATVSAKATLKPTGNFTLEPCTLQSSLGAVELKAQGVWTGSSVKDARGVVLFNLEGEQGALLRPWLGLLVPTARLPSEGPIQCDFRAGPCSGSGSTQVRLGSMCLRLECGA